MATFVYQAAMRDEMFPRKPLPPVTAPPTVPAMKSGKKGADKGAAKPAATVES